MVNVFSPAVKRFRSEMWIFRSYQYKIRLMTIEFQHPHKLCISPFAVRLARVSKGLSQEALACQAQVSTSCIVRWECGHHAKPHPRTLWQVARALEVTVEDLLIVPEVNN